MAFARVHSEGNTKVTKVSAVADLARSRRLCCVRFQGLLREKLLLTMDNSTPTTPMTRRCTSVISTTLGSGVAFWPADCIYSRGALHYPIGADLFTSLLVIEGAPIQWCFLALGILSSAAIAETLWKMGRNLHRRRVPL